MGARFKTEGITLKKGDLIMALTSNQHVLDWVKEMEELMTPDKTIWIDGSEGQLRALREQAFATGELTELNQEELPGCVLHHSAKNDVARVEDRTFICTSNKADDCMMVNWMDPNEMKAKLLPLYKNVMAGRTMYVIPYCMGPIGSPFSKVGVEVTDSIYVVLNMDIMTRVGVKALRQLGDSNDFVRGQHARADIDPENRYIVQFPEDNAIWSINSGYGGNVLLGKKCFALRIASYQGYKEGWMAEHMLILGIQNPRGEIKYISAAFPSACGKTNLAMLIPPEGLQRWGWRVWCVGDDIAWLRVGKDGRLWAVNPENGFFGVAPGTSMKSNPNALISTHKDTIFTNVALDLSDNTVWWEGLNKTPPARAIDWRGRPWTPQSPEKAAHPNSRFTAPARNCPCLSPEFDNPEGVPISAIVFGGRRAKTAPLVYQSFNWQHGVFIGSIMASETTAAATGRVGVVRRDPMAMLPFCGYHMGDYWQHWLDMGKKIPKPPKIFNVNWFRTDEDGNFAWPGFGDNMRVLQWIISRADDEIGAAETALGYEPNTHDIDMEGLEMSMYDMRRLLSVDRDLWLQECSDARAYYEKIGKVPEELYEELDALEMRLNRGYKRK